MSSNSKPPLSPATICAASPSIPCPAWKATARSRSCSTRQQGASGAPAHRRVPRLRALHPGPALLGSAGDGAAPVRHLPGVAPPRGEQGARPRSSAPTGHAHRRQDAPPDALRADPAVARAALLPPVLARPAVRLRLRGRSAHIVGVAQQYPDIAKKGILLRKFGQEVIRLTAGKRVHGTGAVPGGVNRSLTPTSARSCSRTPTR